MKVLSIIISIGALILSVFSFCVSKGTLNFDKINFIIGVLAVLVTTLIGWQIYNYIGIKEELNKFEKKIGDFQLETERIIDEKVQKTADRIEKENLQNISTIGFEFYYNFITISLINDIDLEAKLSFFIATIIYGKQIENKNEEILASYSTVIKFFVNMIRNNEEQIKNIDEDVKIAILKKIKLFPQIMVFKELEQLLSQENK